MKDFTDLMALVKEFKNPLDGVECVIYLTIRQIMSVIQKLELFKGLSEKNVGEILKAWDALKERQNEINAGSKFMDVILQVRGGLSSSEYEGGAGLHVDEGEEFSILSQGEDVHIMVQEWINMVFPFLKEMHLQEALYIA